MTPEKRILEAAREMFLSYGYSKTSMTNIAKKLGMSKKTLYNYYASKEELLSKIIQSFFKVILLETEKIQNDDSIDFPEKIRSIFAYTGTKLSSINPHFLEDISINAPTIWYNIHQIKQEIAFKSFYNLISEGQKKGHIKKTINKSLAVLIYTSAIQTIIEPSFTKQIPNEMLKEMPYSTEGIFEGLMEILFEGFLV